MKTIPFSLPPSACELVFLARKRGGERGEEVKEGKKRERDLGGGGGGGAMKELLEMPNGRRDRHFHTHKKREKEKGPQLLFSSSSPPFQLQSSAPFCPHLLNHEE